MADCLFCNLHKIQSQILFETKNFNVILDGMPVSPGHSIIIPKRHILSLLDLNEREFIELKEVIKKTYKLINALDWVKKYNEVLADNSNEATKLFIENILHSKFLKERVQDFNLGVNDGINAGRTIDHLHIHIIPRYKGDVEDPIGGVRNVIPGMGNYRNVRFPLKQKILSFAQKGVVLNKARTKILVSKYLSSKYLANKLNGKMCLPGGQLEWGEEPDNSFIREVKEETGVKIKTGKPVMIKTWKYEKDGKLKQIVAVSRIGYYSSGVINEPYGEQETTMAKAKWVELKRLNPDNFVIDEQPVIKYFLENFDKLV